MKVDISNGKISGSGRHAIKVIGVKDGSISNFSINGSHEDGIHVTLKPGGRLKVDEYDIKNTKGSAIFVGRTDIPEEVMRELASLSQQEISELKAVLKGYNVETEQTPGGLAMKAEKIAPKVGKWLASLLAAGANAAKIAEYSEHLDGVLDSLL